MVLPLASPAAVSPSLSLKPGSAAHGYLPKPPSTSRLIAPRERSSLTSFSILPTSAIETSRLCASPCRSVATSWNWCVVPCSRSACMSSTAATTAWFFGFCDSRHLHLCAPSASPAFFSCSLSCTFSQRVSCSACDRTSLSARLCAASCTSRDMPVCACENWCERREAILSLYPFSRFCSTLPRSECSDSAPEFASATACARFLSPTRAPARPGARTSARFRFSLFPSSSAKERCSSSSGRQRDVAPQCRQIRSPLRRSSSNEGLRPRPGHCGLRHGSTVPGGGGGPIEPGCGRASGRRKPCSAATSRSAAAAAARRLRAAGSPSDECSEVTPVRIESRAPPPGGRRGRLDGSGM
mmetsp:Transcript_25149/g.81896  ORF Transcript_25149/g.81896 Transcript_25149/m.81896 type:complete len:355 (+) Transcript_25149:591-1655(+)